MTRNMRFTDTESETGYGPGGLTDGGSDGYTAALVGATMDDGCG